MDNSTSAKKPDPSRIIFPTIHQQAILKEVSTLFHEADPAEYITHINALLGLGLKYVGDPAYIGEVAFHTTRIVTLIARLGDLTRYQREELLQGGMSETEVFWHS